MCVFEKSACVIIRLILYFQGWHYWLRAEPAAGAAQVTQNYSKLKLSMGPDEKRLCLWSHLRLSQVSGSRAPEQKDVGEDLNLDRFEPSGTFSL